jgi:hypothetical protein
VERMGSGASWSENVQIQCCPAKKEPSWTMDLQFYCCATETTATAGLLVPTRVVPTQWWCGLSRGGVGMAHKLMIPTVVTAATGKTVVLYCFRPMSATYECVVVVCRLHDGHGGTQHLGGVHADHTAPG